MKTLLLSSLIIFSSAFMTDDFKSQQQKFPRVKTAYEEKEKLVKELFSSKGVELSSANIFIRVFKKEAQLEIWAKPFKDEKYQLIKTYSICSSSGDLGPKRKQGDGQVPEGFYEIDRFNPSSNFYLSLGVSYPNASDKILGGKGNLGGDIFIHGNCVTIGCMPLTDDKIKEVYLMAVEAKSNGQTKIPVHIFPFRMNETNMKSYEEKYKEDSVMISFWKNIQKGFDHFENNKMLPAVSVQKSGEYIFK
ncbi:MAG: L,D-transpeptidase family protein [Bacteroidetes bacterium]|nr:L,D-transpeptidase family protein [Bacteroidota bacterium]